MFDSILGYFGQAGINTWLRICGRKVGRADHSWLNCPMGPEPNIGDQIYHQIAAKTGLEIEGNVAEGGLIEDFAALKSPEFDPERVHHEIRHFYEQTSKYQMEVWTEATPLPGLFLKLLVKTVSRRMNQLNFPTSSLETSRGMTSEILKLRDPESKQTIHTGWLRKLTATGQVVYAGLYGVEKPPGSIGNCVKVTFPIPNGSANVILKPENGENGSFHLNSSGKTFGDPGFYRMLVRDECSWYVRHLKTLREHFHVYLDSQNTLRTDHTVRFLGMTVLRLHYRLNPILPSTRKKDVPDSELGPKAE